MRSPTFQYQARAESYDDSAGYAYSVALLDWWLPWPDFAPGRRPLVAEGWFAFGGDQGTVVDVPEGLDLVSAPSFLWPHPRHDWPNLPVIFGDWIATPPDPPAIGPPGLTPPLIPRDPELPDRLRRAIDRLSVILNSLIRQGRLVQVSATEWRLFDGRYAEARQPTPDDGTDVGARPGMLWFDTATSTLYVCFDATQGSADWRTVTTS